MKKQILILAMFTLAIMFTGTTKVFGQLLPSAFPTPTAPRPLLNCIGTPQQPKAGISYNYLLEETGTNAPATDFQFWATKDPNFVNGTPTVTNEVDSLHKALPGELLDYSANYQGGGITPSVDITWSPEILANTIYQSGTAGDATFVVGWATDGCTDNIKVWEIDPTPSFTIDIVNIDPATKEPLAYDATTTQCVDEVRAAVYNVASFQVDYNYGWDTLYYEVIAANFVTSWVPTFFITGLDGTIQTAEISWAASMADAEASSFIESGLDISTTGTVTGTTPLTSVDPNTNNGVSLIVQVIIANNNYETLAQEIIQLSVAGEDAVGFDINDDATCSVPANATDAAADDFIDRTVDPRPTIIAGTPTLLLNGGTTVVTP